MSFAYSLNEVVYHEACGKAGLAYTAVSKDGNFDEAHPPGHFVWTRSADEIFAMDDVWRREGSIDW